MGSARRPRSRRTGFSKKLRRAFLDCFDRALDSLERDQGIEVSGLWLFEEIDHEALLDFVDGSSDEIELPLMPPDEWFRGGRLDLGEWFAPPAVRVEHVIRLEFVLGNLEPERLYTDRRYGSWHNMAIHEEVGAAYVHPCTHIPLYRSRCETPFDLAELNDRVNEVAGGPPDSLARACAGQGGLWGRDGHVALAAGFDARSLAAPFLAKPSILIDLLDFLERRGIDWQTKEWAQGLCRTIGALPEIPDELEQRLREILAGKRLGKMKRKLRDALSDHPGFASPVTAPAKPAPRRARSVATLWKRIAAWLAEHAPHIHASLNPPATAKQIGRLEKVLGRPLPKELRALLELANGQGGAAPFLGMYHLLSIEEMLSHREMMQELVRAKDYPDGLWRPGRLPVLGEDANQFCLDLDACDAKGRAPVVFTGEYEGARDEPVAPSLTAVLERLLDAMEQGELAPEEDRALSGLGPYLSLDDLMAG